MALQDHLERPERPSRLRCSMWAVFGRLSADDAATLRRVLADDSFSAAQIAAALRKEGHHVQPGTVARHRRQECSCAV